ncbi:uncharacterized protein N7459_001994 [Penicillium hispanicum]|uniref:uncharacterized protein n=1 Tax=Penicillium hispanicum TaxID=1080232 RepID=UPI00253F9B73|nr:uncharacterized protein N7459_001994 [Penicillium hispanicum]KAJ5591625.1 hypothetical protein N7459_001994 [Penicillium hispanicum]
MADQPRLRPMLPPLGPPNPNVAKKKARISAINILKEQFSLSTWILLGAVIQGVVVLMVPLFYAVLPAMVIISYRVVDVLLMTAGITRNRFLDGVIMGKFTGQIPNREGVYANQPSDENVVAFQLITRLNHPLGVFSPGALEIGKLAKDMYTALKEDPEKYGFLGQETLLGADGREAGNHIITMMYFRSLDDVHNFAHGPLHTDTWHWWNTKGKHYGYLTIGHELYSSSRNQWENIYINAEPTGLPGTVVKVKKIEEDGKEMDGQWEYVHPIIDARRGKLAKQYGRVNRSNQSTGKTVDYDY